MLYYILIDNTDGIDESEGQDIAGNTELKSKKCISCHFFISVLKILDMKKMSVMDVIIV